MVLINLHSKNGWSFINHLILPKPDPLMSKIFMLSRNFQLNFRVTVWKLIPASTFYVIHHQNLIKIANKKRYAAVGFSGGKLKPLQ